mgnify:CR=1 FL=1
MTGKELYIKFRNGSCHIFISTDLAARGLDIPDIKNVVHYHLPVAEDGFIHRNGRTARWEADGSSYIILHSEEQLPSYIKEEPEDISCRLCFLNLPCLILLPYI